MNHFTACTSWKLNVLKHSMKVKNTKIFTGSVFILKLYAQTFLCSKWFDLCLSRLRVHGYNCLLSHLPGLDRGFVVSHCHSNTLYSSLKRIDMQESINNVPSHHFIWTCLFWRVEEGWGGNDFANVEWMTLPVSFLKVYIYPLFWLLRSRTEVRLKKK